MGWYERALRSMIRRMIRAALAPLEDKVATCERRLAKLEGPHPYRVPAKIQWHVSQPTEEN